MQQVLATPIREWSKSIRGADDFELGIPRTTPLIYHCTAPETGPAKGLVFLIPDFNDDADGNEFIALRRHLALEYGLLAVTVEYHCYRSRLKDGAQFVLSDDEFRNLSSLCASHGIALLDRNALIAALKQLPVAYEFEFRVAPTGSDYQNLGVMQALDHLAVLNDIQNEPDGITADCSNVIAMGVGYGGYLGNLIAKFAPNALRSVFACDAYTLPPSSFLFGAQPGDSAGSTPPYYYHIGKTRIFPIINTRWSDDINTPNSYSVARQAIRNTAIGSHLATMKLAARNSFHFRIGVTNTCPDDIARNIGSHLDLLRAAGFDVEVDKTLHSGSNTLREMFESFYPSLPLPPTSRKQDSSVAYLSGNLLYCFDHDQFGNQVSILPIEKQPPQRMLNLF